MIQIKMIRETKIINNKGAFREILNHKNKRKVVMRTGPNDLFNLWEYISIIPLIDNLN